MKPDSNVSSSGAQLLSLSVIFFFVQFGCLKSPTHFLVKAIKNDLSSLTLPDRLQHQRLPSTTPNCDVFTASVTVSALTHYSHSERV